MRRSLALGLVALAACGGEGSDGAPSASSTPSSVTSTAVATVTTAPSATAATEPEVLPEGFDTVAARAVAADGTACDLCLYLAADDGDRARGLMFATALGGPDGMAFRYDEPTSGAFWMKDTRLPLSIAFFGADGGYLGAFDMEPCTADPCDVYPTPAGFQVAVETLQGGLAELAIAPGSTLELLDLPCQR